MSTILQHKPTEDEGNELALMAKTAAAKMVWRHESQGWRLRVKVAAEGTDKMFDFLAFCRECHIVIMGTAKSPLGQAKDRSICD